MRVQIDAGHADAHAGRRPRTRVTRARRCAPVMSATERVPASTIVFSSSARKMRRTSTTPSSPATARPQHVGRRDQHGVRAERERLEDVRPATEPTVDEYRHPTRDCLDDLGEHGDRRMDRIELTPAVVRHDDRVDAGLDGEQRVLGGQEPLHQQRHRSGLPDPREIVPGEVGSEREIVHGAGRSACRTRSAYRDGAGRLAGKSTVKHTAREPLGMHPVQHLDRLTTFGEHVELPPLRGFRSARDLLEVIGRGARDHHDRAGPSGGASGRELARRRAPAADRPTARRVRGTRCRSPGSGWRDRPARRRSASAAGSPNPRTRDGSPPASTRSPAPPA